MGSLTEIERPDGSKCPVYIAEPAAGASAPGLVVVQEWWGLNEQIKTVADDFAAQGYRAVVPDLFRGKVASDADEANHLMTNLDFADAAGQDIRGCIQFLKGGGSPKVAVGGFCMGGALTLVSAVFVPEMDAGVCYYGIPPLDQVPVQKAQAPLLMHFGTKDDWCSPALVADLTKALDEGGVTYTVHSYEADHAFVNQTRPEVYDAEATRLARQRTLAFLAAELKG